MVEATQTPATKAKTIANDMDARQVFANADLAASYLTTVSTYEGFEETPKVIQGFDPDTGLFDPAVYTDDMRVLVAVLKNREKNEKGEALPSSIKAIVVTPVPSLESILANDAAKVWLNGILDKELNHVAVRALRQADDVDSVSDQMPTTLESYISSKRETGGIMESFDSTFKLINSTLAKKSPVWAKQRLIKTDLKKAMESKAFASEYFPTLEDRPARKDGGDGSIFVIAIGLGKALCEKQGLDPAIFDKWLESRNAKTLKDATANEEEFDLEDLEIEDEAEVAPTPATESTEVEGEPAA
jgi:hypothetical protein